LAVKYVREDFYFEGVLQTLAYNCNPR